MAAPRAIASSIPAYARTRGRAVHIKINPRPLNLSESRHVLRMLQEFGEVVMYKHLKHEPEIRAPNTALAIFGTTEAASRAIGASPLKFSISKQGRHKMPQEKQVEEEQQDEHAPSQRSERPIADYHTPLPSQTTTSSSSTASASSLSSSSSSSTVREFHLSISPSTQNHAAYISRQHYNGNFELETRTIMGQDLEERVPVKAIADLRWGLGEVPLRIRNARAEEERRDGRGWWKQGLGSMWREGQKERERKNQKERDEEATG